MASVGSWLFLFARIETQLGKDALAISSIFRQLILFFSIPTWSLGSTANTIISNMLGRRDFTGLKQAIWRISLVSVGISLVFVPGYLFIPPVLHRHFYQCAGCSPAAGCHPYTTGHFCHLYLDVVHQYFI